MKKILLIICLFPILVFSQKSYKIPADSTILNNIGSGKNELVIRNATSNITGGVLTNLGNGVTAFVLGGGSARVVDTIYKNNTKDSIVFTISGIRYAVKDSFNLNTDSQTLSISNDTLTISGGNSVILPVYIQIDSSTINSYDVLNSQNTPPISPNTGDVYLVGTVPTGAWVGQAKDIAEWNGSSWGFTDGVQGDFLYNATTALTYIFRSGNWVQTTGIPALNNGNTISSGLRIGTNNARSLTFETNNVNRGRFDSVGRFHIYNLPTSSTSDTFVTKSDLSGKLTKVGQSTFLSGVNTDAQTLSLTRDTLSISGGNSLKLPSTIFNNGLKIIESAGDYTLSSADAGYCLVTLEPNTNIITPTPCPFNVGDIVGVVADRDTTIVDVSPDILGVQLLAGESFENSEWFIMQCVDIGGEKSMYPLSAIKDDNGTLKTINKYLYDQSQNAIPLSGTEVGKPVTGDIEVSPVSIGNIYNNDGSQTTSISFEAGATTIRSKQNDNSLNGSFNVTTYSATFNSDDATSPGFQGAQDYSANITDLDYTQKIYVDNAISSNRKVDTSYIFRNATLDSTCMITVINGNSYRSCAKDSVGSGTAYTFSTGLTNTSSTITNNLSTGVSGGQSVIGGTSSGNNLTLSSTSNATKGKILFGTSAYDEVNNRLGIGTTTPGNLLSIVGNSSTPGGVAFNVKNSNASGDTRFSLSTSSNKSLTVQVTGSSYPANQNGAYLFTDGGLSNMTFMTDGDVASGGSGYISFVTGGYTLATQERMRITSTGNIGIGTTTPAASAILDLTSTTKGLKLPTMTSTQASAIATPAQGLMLFVTDTNGTFTSVGWWGYNGATWEKLNN